MRKPIIVNKSFVKLVKKLDFVRKSIENINNNEIIDICDDVSDSDCSDQSEICEKEFENF